MARHFTASELNSFLMHLERLLGDGYNFIVAPSGVDPVASIRVYVACKKHKTYKTLECDYYNSPPFDEEILAAARACEGCIAEAAAILPPTRWPEGAEL